MAFIKNRYFQLVCAYILFSLTGITANLAALSGGGFWLFFYVGLQLFILGVYALIWQQIIKKFNLVMLISGKGLLAVINLLWAALLFGENISASNIVGALVVVIGVCIVARGEGTTDA